MDLTLTHNTPLNTEFVRPDGVALYSTSTPHKLSGQTTKILKYTIGDGPDAKGSMDETARINWHYIGPTQIIYKGEKLEVDKFLPKTGKLTDTRSFIAPNGQTYRWKIGIAPYLETADSKRVATYHPGSILTGKKARVEVDVSVLDFIDLVIITWVYMEKTNRDHGGALVGSAA